MYAIDKIKQNASDIQKARILLTKVNRMESSLEDENFEYRTQRRIARCNHYKHNPKVSSEYKVKHYSDNEMYY